MLADQKVLEINDLHVHYITPRGAAVAANAVNLYVKAGEIVGLVGESGCGKTTVAMAILQMVQTPGRIVKGEIKLNGRDLGALWKPPFELDVTRALKPGKNELEIKVTNLWPNRMIGDEQLPEDSDRETKGTLKSWPAWLAEGKPSPTGRYTFTSWRLWKKDDPLVESGLLGPVTVQTAERVDMK